MDQTVQHGAYEAYRVSFSNSISRGYHPVNTGAWHLLLRYSVTPRSAIEVAKLWEWGGMGNSGANEFSKHRPGWELPIHGLLVKHGVSIVFHGHYHLFVKQELDGIVYQEVPQPGHPQPGHPRSGNTNTAKEYGYLQGETQSSSGFMGVRVGSESVRADYVRTFLPAVESPQHKNGDVTFSYSLLIRLQVIPHTGP